MRETITSLKSRRFLILQKKHAVECSFCASPCLCVPQKNFIFKCVMMILKKYAVWLYGEEREEKFTDKISFLHIRVSVSLP